MSNVNIGLAPNDGTGDDLRAAFAKLNGTNDDVALQLTAMLSNIGKIFPDRATALSTGQSNLPAVLGTIITLEGTAVVLRKASATALDPLFGTAPRWGVVITVDVEAEAALRANADDDLQRQLDSPFEGSEDASDIWLATDVSNNGLFAWTSTGFKTRMSDWTIADLNSRLAFGEDFETKEGLNQIVMDTDSSGSAIRVMKKDGQDMIMSASFWERGETALGLNGGLARLSTDEWHAIGVNGQSLSIGGPWDESANFITEAEFMALVDRNSALMLTGMERGDNVPILTVDMPRSVGYNNVLPTGYGPAIPSATNITAAIPMAYLLNLYRSDAGVKLVPVITQCHGISGIAIEDIDNDPNTGTGALIVWNNLTTWNRQVSTFGAASGFKVTVPWHDWVHGTSAQGYPEGSYEAQLWKYQTDMRQMLFVNGIEGDAVFVMTQPGGNADISTNEWFVCDEILAFCEKGGGVLATPLYAYEIWDNNVHPDAYATIQYQEVKAKAMATVESGRNWTIHRPKVSLTGTTITATFDSLWENEYLVQHPMSRYGGNGIDSFLGFEIEGGAITSVTIYGHTVIIECNATPTELRYAFQTQDASVFANNKYSAHRGLLRTSHKWQSKILDGVTLYRWVPSFIIQL
jgi:hypothetical protein